MSEFTKAEIRSKEQQQQDISEKIADCVRREKEINLQLSACRESLLRKNTVTKPEQIQRKISDYEKKLSEILREHERYEERRDEICRDLERLQENLAREEHLQQREDQRKEKAKRDFYQAVSFSAGTMAGAVVANKQRHSQKEHRVKERAPRKIGKWLFLFVIVAAAINTMFSKDSKSVEPTRGTATPSGIETELPQNGLSYWIGMTADEIFIQYGEAFSLGYIAGSNYFYYEDEQTCPYSFYYDETFSEPAADDLIWGVATGTEGICVAGNIDIGDSLQQVEETLGYALNPKAEEGSDFFPYLETEIKIDEVSYLLLFGAESKNLVYAMGRDHI